MSRFVFSLFVGLSLFASSALAAGPYDEVVIEKFRASEDVQSAISQNERFGFSLADDIKVIEFGGGCGFAGCDVAFLVVQKMATTGINPMRTSVLAVVDVPAVGEMSVTVVRLEPVTEFLTD